MSHEAVNSAPGRARATHDDVIDLAYAWFRAGRRVDIGQLARELGIGRATVYRWCSGREHILGEVVWRILIEAIERVESRHPGDDAATFIENFGRMAAMVRSYEPLERFLADDPEYALRVLTSRYSVVQGRLIDWTVARLRLIPDIESHTDATDLAYAIVRVGESFIWSDMITGQRPQPDKATTMVRLLVVGACSRLPLPGDHSGH